MFRFRVSYLHLSNCRVVRSFPTYAEAEEFITLNALVWPLPGLIREYLPTTGTHYLSR